MFEEVLKYFTYKYGLQSITLRLFTPYGENDNEDKIIPQIIKSLLNNDKLQVKNKNQELNFIYIDDIVNAYVYSIEKLRNTQEPYYQKFDIGNTDSYSIPQIIFTLQQISGLDGKFSFSEQNQKNYLYKNCNLSYTKENLGWEPLVPIEEGLKKTWLSYLGKKNKNEK